MENGVDQPVVLGLLDQELQQELRRAFMIG